MARVCESETTWEGVCTYIRDRSASGRCVDCQCVCGEPTRARRGRAGTMSEGRACASAGDRIKIVPFTSIIGHTQHRTRASRECRGFTTSRFDGQEHDGRRASAIPIAHPTVSTSDAASHDRTGVRTTCVLYGSRLLDSAGGERTTHTRTSALDGCRDSWSCRTVCFSWW